MLEYQGDLNPTANAADAPTNSNIRQAYTEIISISDATDSSNITNLLASTFNDEISSKDIIIHHFSSYGAKPMFMVIP